MNITFTAPTPFVKPWTLEDSRIIFGNDIINLGTGTRLLPFGSEKIPLTRWTKSQRKQTVRATS